jgi:hypothetical protein
MEVENHKENKNQVFQNKYINLEVMKMSFVCLRKRREVYREEKITFYYYLIWGLGLYHSAIIPA